jgi:hypothetical protein
MLDCVCGDGMRKLNLVLSSIFALLIVSGAKADDAAMEKYRNWLPGQIRGMSEKQRDAEVPMTYIMAANTALSPLGELAVQSDLNTLMYNGIGDLDGAKRRFQSDLGEEPTGNFTVSQIAKLVYRAERTRLTTVSFFPFKFGGKVFSDTAYVRGTVKLVEESIAYPVNYVEIQCTKSEGICTYRQLVLNLPDENSWAQSYSVMEAVNETYRITRWDANRIDARPETEGQCRINELRLNFAAKEFYEFATNAPEGNCEMPLGGSLPKLEKPRVAQIVDGDPLIREQFQKISKETYPFLSSEFRARIEAISPPAN